MFKTPHQRRNPWSSLSTILGDLRITGAESRCHGGSYAITARLLGHDKGGWGRLFALHDIRNVERGAFNHRGDSFVSKRRRYLLLPSSFSLSSAAVRHVSRDQLGSRILELRLFEYVRCFLRDIAVTHSNAEK